MLMNSRFAIKGWDNLSSLRLHRFLLLAIFLKPHVASLRFSCSLSASPWHSSRWSSRFRACPQSLRIGKRNNVLPLLWRNAMLHAVRYFLISLLESDPSDERGFFALDVTSHSHKMFFIDCTGILTAHTVFVVRLLFS